ncbi:MAG TPA: bifunctional methylenetetrahydrofolate dehydrogenase/methenyltetrahydrofolate cyclohydrolase FolD [Spirochaetota bacterium]|nr:bifunctional methylenetetrahydrofolate dehydrogenase/methenyltetrahydrofolate cyclohydrolase FolD [Spirochaetota bacterium]
MTKIIDGKAIANEIKQEIKKDVAKLEQEYGKKPTLAVILVGNDGASEVYVRMKKKTSEELGINSLQITLDESTTQSELLKLIHELNSDTNVNGILVQLPLPSHIDENIIINAIDPIKDVDGFHPINLGKLVIGSDDSFVSCTPHGCQELIVRNVPDLKGKHLVIVGRSNIVGKPLANIMLQKNERANCIVTICHTATSDIGYYTRQADILVVAVGKANMITKNMVKPGAVVIDVGINRIDDLHNSGKIKLVGDVKFDEVSEIASAITPVPGGVGPMTIVMLMKNTVKAFRLQNKV